MYNNLQAFCTHKWCFLLHPKSWRLRPTGIALVGWFLFCCFFSSSQVSSGRTWEAIHCFNVSGTNKIGSEVSYFFDFLQLGILHVIVGKDGTNEACQARKWYFCHSQNRYILCASTITELKLTMSRSAKAIIWLHQFLKQNWHCFIRFF